MGQIITYGLGGYCKNCDPSHPHPLNNLVEVTEVNEFDEEVENAN